MKGLKLLTGRRILRTATVTIGTLGISSFCPSLFAQAPGRIATSVEALVASPVFFHGKQVVVRRPVIDTNGLTELADTTRPIFVRWKEGATGRSDGEIRGEFWDIGRLREDDPRFTAADFKPILEVASRGQWPPRDQVFLIQNATFVEAPIPAAPTIRAIALDPVRYTDRTATVVGRFHGRNLFGDLPLAPGKSRWDFVLQSADAAVWITGLRPRGKGFDLDVEARVDTNRWLEVTGTIRHAGALTWIEATSIATGTAPTETPIDVAVPPAPREIPPKVVFSAPLAGETDVDRATPVRIQFSRDMDGRTFRDRVRIAYADTPPAGGAAAPPPFTARYNEGTRALEIRFAAPLDRLRTMHIELVEGILSAVDNQPLAPWSLTFMTGT